MFCVPRTRFSAVPRASGPVFKSCTPGLIFGGADCVMSRFHIFRARTFFWGYRRRRVPLFCAPEIIFGGTDSVGSLFMFCDPGFIFDGTEGVGSRFHVLRSKTHFRRYRGRRFPFSYFALPVSFSVEPWASRPVFMFCAPRLVFGGTEGVGTRFHVFRAPNSFSAVPRALGPVFMVCAPELVFRRYRGRRLPF
jgi:hypothetical protein